MKKIIIVKETETSEYISGFSTFKRATDYARFERGLTKFINRGSTGERWYYASDGDFKKAKDSGNYGLYSVISLREIPVNIDLKVRA